MIGGAVAVVAFALYRKHQAATTAASASANNLGATLGTIPTGYANTAADPGQVYTGWDQLEGQIQALQNQLNQAGTAANHNPTPTPTPLPAPSTLPLLTPGPSPALPSPPPTPAANVPTPPPGQPVPASLGKAYTVQKGDTLWGIAQTDTGNGQNWQTIYNNNKGVIGSNPNLIFPGEKLTIP